MSDCYVAAGKTRSQGAEAELIGRPAQGWDSNASYTYNDNRIVNNGNATQAGLIMRATRRAISGSSGPIIALSLIAAPAAMSGVSGVASIQAGYQWNRYLSLDATLNNIANKRYYQRLGNLNDYNFYGEPRSNMLTLRSNF